MAGRQGAAGHQGARAPLSGLAVAVHDSRQAAAALRFGRERGLAIVLVSAPGAAAYAGAGFFRAIEELLHVSMVMDCSGDAGLVLAALRSGLRRIVFDGPDELRRRLDEIATMQGACVRARLETPCLVLEPGEDTARRLSLETGLAYPAPPLLPSSQGSSRV